MSVEQVTQLALASSRSFQPRRSSYLKALNSGERGRWSKTEERMNDGQEEE